MTIIRTVRNMQRWADAARRKGRRIGFVPTMGYLHEGHLSLVRVARQHSDLVVASIFVNPLQFGPKEDLRRYPRDFPRDRRLLAREKVDVIFCPETAEMYAADFCTSVQVGVLTETLCGASRPGHFRGVTTVVAKLFNAVKPHVAVMGAKDAQQAYVIRRMIRDLDFDIELVVAPTVREPGGLALSSRNTYLTPKQRKEASTLSIALSVAHDLILIGIRNPERIKQGIRDTIAEDTSGRIDYVEIVDTRTLRPVKRIRGEVLIALAVRFGKTRLIDNSVVQP